ncbi:uncharacterized protein LOC112051475 [Bicyclus anynana]|uniref:Uncharacterized protein LOC112051475 n=1 Tax=Bicyclus anynana TaxID=110368 RepID=A0ABM3LGF0_BICAN|nr:uncharacterized protein LOC112051475 [Bicyclus anynana]
MLSLHGIMPGHILPTRENNCLDHFMIKLDKNKLSAKIAVLNTTITDHSMILLNLTSLLPYFKSKKVTKIVTDFDSALLSLAQNNLSELLFCYDPQLVTDKLFNYLSEALNENSRIVKIPSNKRIIKPWITIGILKCIRNRNKMQRKLKLDPKNEILRISYRRYRNFCKNLIIKLKRSYDKKQLEMSLKNSKILWQNIKSVTNMNHSNSDNSNLLNTKSSPLESINYVNHYFANIGKKLAEDINYRQEPFETRNLNYKTQLNSFVLLETNIEEVNDILMNLKSNSSPGWDNIPSSFLKLARDHVVPIICHLINLCFNKGVFPAALKRSNIIPIYKSGDKDDINNYRPISVLPSISKIMEKIMNSRLLNYLEKFHLLSDSQYGFRHGRSTDDAVTALTSFVDQQINSKKKCLATFLDLRKAFDTVSVPILVRKLENLGIRDVSLALFKDYLTGRTQRVKIGLIGRGVCQTTIDLNFDNNLIAHNGLGWPLLLKVVKGNEALMKLRIPVKNQRTCTVTDPSGVRFDVTKPPNTRYQKWGDKCGIRVKNVKEIDRGRWRLSASGENDSVVGWIELNILEVTSPDAEQPISLQDGETHTKVALSTIDNAYCVVAKPFAESSLVSGQCSVTLDRTTRAVQGNWQVLLGLPGRVSEVHTKRHVTVQTERLDVGYVHDATDKLHIYCNILHSNKEITFCRFQRTSDTYGYNVIDGLSDGSYSYYGDGFLLKQCGITIEKPSSKDYSTWRCSVGVHIKVGNVMQQQPPMQALISVASSHKSLRDFDKNEDTLRKVFVQKDSPFTITCNAGVSLRYCWFQHPNGTQFTPVPLTHEDQLFWYTGKGLDVGDCGITFLHSNITDDGKWSCFMGPRLKKGIEAKDEVEVRVTGPLAANLREVPANIGKNTTLYCHTSNGRRPLQYCRFLSPKFVGMNVDSSVNKENAILNRFYFTPERHLDFGDCSLSITSVQEEDIGVWTCAAVVDNEILESSDTIRVFIGETDKRPRLQAGIIGGSVGVSFLVVVLIGYVTYKRGWIQHLLSLRNRTHTVVSEDITLPSRSSAPGSISSDASTPRSVSSSGSTIDFSDVNLRLDQNN